MVGTSSLVCLMHRLLFRDMKENKARKLACLYINSTDSTGDASADKQMSTTKSLLLWSLYLCVCACTCVFVALKR